MKKQKMFDNGDSTFYGLFGPITDEAVSPLCEWLIGENYNVGTEEIPRPSKLVVMINSVGGELQAAFSVIELINASKIPVQTIALGQACSAGLMIFMAGTKGLRTITPSCSILSHNYSTEVGGSHHEIINAQKELVHVYDKCLRHYKLHTGKSEKYIIQHLLTKSDEWITPEEAVKHGLGDTVCENIGFLYP